MCMAETKGGLFKRGGTGWEVQFSGSVLTLHTILSSVPENKINKEE